MLALPSLGENQPDSPSGVTLADIVGCRISRAGADPVFERRMPVHEILDDELYANVFQIIVPRRIPRVVADRNIERVVGRLDVVVPGNRARERAAANRAAIGD